MRRVYSATFDMLEAFRRKASAVSPCSPFDPFSRAAYAITAIWAALTWMAFLISGFSLGNSSTYIACYGLLWTLLTALVSRRYGFPQIALALECISFVPVVGALTVVSTILLAAYSSPLRDGQLIGADRTLGFEWLDLLLFYRRIPGMMTVFGWAYYSFLWQMGVVPIILFLRRDRRSLWIFMTAWAVSSMMTCALFPFAPAEGPYVHYGISNQDVPELHRAWQWQFGPLIRQLQSGQIHDLSKALMGIVQFPSFHAAAAVMLSWGTARTRWFAPFLLLNLAMIFSTLINGAHYLTDVAAGLLVGSFSLYVANRLVDWSAGSEKDTLTERYDPNACSF